MTLDFIIENSTMRRVTATLLTVLLASAVVLAAKYGLISAFFEWLGQTLIYLSHPTETHLPSFLERLNPTWIECN